MRVASRKADTSLITSEREPGRLPRTVCAMEIVDCCDTRCEERCHLDGYAGIPRCGSGGPSLLMVSGLKRAYHASLSPLISHCVKPRNSSCEGRQPCPETRTKILPWTRPVQNAARHLVVESWCRTRTSHTQTYFLLRPASCALQNRGYAHKGRFGPSSENFQGASSSSSTELQSTVHDWTSTTKWDVTGLMIEGRHFCKLGDDTPPRKTRAALGSLGRKTRDIDNDLHLTSVGCVLISLAQRSVDGSPKSGTRGTW